VDKLGDCGHSLFLAEPSNLVSYVTQSCIHANVPTFNVLIVVLLSAVSRNRDIKGQAEPVVHFASPFCSALWNKVPFESLKRCSVLNYIVFSRQMAV